MNRKSSRKKGIPVLVVVAILLLSLLVILSGCGKREPEPELTTQELHELYPGDIDNVDYIEIRDGSTGELVRIKDQAVIRDWVSEVRHFEFVPDPNQEDRVGYLYAVTLYEHEEAKLSFTPSSTNGHYYIHNEELKLKIKELFESMGG
ncbi:hypothetical protein QYF50_17365 [Paenibacillus vini]|uniref:hypothetical protein n=1 Tax=Paenibacillus vini TaxID=1476024 RepID=UPI0025B6B8D6|nr:hypothetical protein [Paenibacillus vini]MDN4069675.1 hypothetical protein [Paenibacillus vini]